MRTIKALRERAEAYGLCIATHNPGDKTRYRIFTRDTDYFGDSPLATYLKLSEVEVFLDGVSVERHNLTRAK